MSNSIKRILVMAACKRYRIFDPIGFNTTAGYHMFWYNTSDGSTHVEKVRAR